MRNTEKTPDLAQLSSMLEWYLEDRKVSVEFVERTHPGGSIIDEYDIHPILDGRRVSLKALANLAMAALFELGCKYTIPQLVAGIITWVWGEYHRQVPNDPLRFKAPARVLIKRPRGRPRKDGTTRTIVREVEEIQSDYKVNIR